MRHQRITAVEWKRQLGAIGDNPIVGGFIGVDHKAATDRVILATRQHTLIGRIRGKAHAVAVIRQLLPFVEYQVGFLVERDALAAEQCQLFALANLRQRRRDDVRVDPFGHFTGQAHQHRLVGTMAAPGQGQRAEQFDAHAHDLFQHAFLLQPAAGETRRCAHRAHRVRGRGANADLEQVEYADCHGCSGLLRLFYAVCTA